MTFEINRRLFFAGLSTAVAGIAFTSDTPRAGGATASGPAGFPSPPPVATPPDVVLTPHVGKHGPTFFVLAAWVQPPPLHAFWKAHGINTMFTDNASFADGTVTYAQWTKSCHDNKLFQIRRPDGSFYTDQGRPKDPVGDHSADDMADPTVIAWMILDEPEQSTLSLADWEKRVAGWRTAGGGKRKPVLVNFVSQTIEVGVLTLPNSGDPIASMLASPSIDWFCGDDYPWHTVSKENLGRTIAKRDKTYAQWFRNTSLFGGPAGWTQNDAAKWPERARTRTYTATNAGVAVHQMHHAATYPHPVLGTAPNGARGRPVFQYVATGRVGLSFWVDNGGHCQPARFQRLFAWDAIIMGVSGLMIFPQCGGQFTLDAGITGKVLTIDRCVAELDYGGKRLEEPRRSIIPTDWVDTFPTSTYGWERCAIVKQLTSIEADGTAGGRGTYQLSEARDMPRGTRNMAAFPLDGTSGNSTDAANLSEWTTTCANLALLQAHPTGGNLLMDPVDGGRRPYWFYLMGDTLNEINDPAIVGNLASAAIEMRPGTGTPGWPKGFIGTEIRGDDDRFHRIVLAYSTEARTTFSYAPWGIDSLAFGPTEVRLMRSGAAGYATTDTANQFRKAGVDD